MGYMEEHTHETAPSFSSSATPVVGYKADNSDITFYFAYLKLARLVHVCFQLLGELLLVGSTHVLIDYLAILDKK